MGITKKQIEDKLVKIKDNVLKLLWEDNWKSDITVVRLKEKNKKDYRVGGELYIADSNALYCIYIQLIEAWYDNDYCGADDNVNIRITFGDGEKTLTLNQHYYPSTKPEVIFEQFKILHNSVDKIIDEEIKYENNN